VPDDGAPESVLLFVAVIPEAFEPIEVVLDQAVECGGLGVTGPVDSLGIAFHMESNRPRDLRANLRCVREAAPDLRACHRLKMLAPAHAPPRSRKEPGHECGPAGRHADCTPARAQRASVLRIYHHVAPFGAPGQRGECADIGRL